MSRVPLDKMAGNKMIKVDKKLMFVEGTAHDLTVAVVKAIQNMSEEEKSKLREHLLWKVYDSKSGGTIQ